MFESKINLKDIQSVKQLAGLLKLRTNTIVYYSKEGRESAYLEFEIDKKTGGKRPIVAPEKELKEIQRRINFLLYKIYSPHPRAFGGLPGKGIKKNSIEHLESRWIMRVDLENFFGTITDKRVFGLFKTLGATNQVATVLTNLVTYKGVLPQGAPTSPLLANMISLRMDNEVRRLAQKLGIRYTRYFDDLVFSASTESRLVWPPFLKMEKPDGVTRYRVTGELKKIIEEQEGFRINQEKTRFRPRKVAQYVTGVKVNANPNVSRQYIRLVRSILHDWEVNGYNASNERFKAKNPSGGNIKQGLRGYIEHIGHIRAEGEKGEDKIYKKLIQRYLKLNPPREPHDFD